jgi:hypothetical protein
MSDTTVSAHNRERLATRDAAESPGEPKMPAAQHQRRRFTVCRFTVCRFTVCRFTVCRFTVCRFTACR